jgi:hypothetical protein
MVRGSADDGTNFGQVARSRMKLQQLAGAASGSATGRMRSNFASGNGNLELMQVRAGVLEGQDSLARAEQVAHLWRARRYSLSSGRDADRAKKFCGLFADYAEVDLAPRACGHRYSPANTGKK